MDERSQALRRLESKRKLVRYAAVYGVVMAILVGIWAWSGDRDFWPAWPALAGAVVLLFFATRVEDSGHSIGSSDADGVQAEIRRSEAMDDREQAVRQLEAKRKLVRHAVVYGSMMAFFIAIWALSGGDYFWPAWPALAWGVALAVHAWIALGQRPISNADIERQMGKNRGVQR